MGETARSVTGVRDARGVGSITKHVRRQHHCTARPDDEHRTHHCRSAMGDGTTLHGTCRPRSGPLA